MKKERNVLFEAEKKASEQVSALEAQLRTVRERYDSLQVESSNLIQQLELENWNLKQSLKLVKINPNQ